MNDREVRKLFEKWNMAIQSGNVDNVVECYAPEAILLPTMSPLVRRNHAEIGDYFSHFLRTNPAGKIDEEHIRIFGDIAVNSGLYTFSLMQGGVRKDVPARFTFVYRKDASGWRIVEHHSSVLPS